MGLNFSTGHTIVENGMQITVVSTISRLYRGFARLKRFSKLNGRAGLGCHSALHGSNHASISFAGCLACLLVCVFPTHGKVSPWPEIALEARPHAYWWWMGSAVDRENLTKELTRYKDAGIGGVHIIPIYGAKGWEEKYLTYLTPEWFEMFNYAVSEARRMGLNVDMTTGTGWCFGGPSVKPQHASSVVVSRLIEVPRGGVLEEKLAPGATLIAYGPDNEVIDISKAMNQNGAVYWRPDSGAWKVYALSSKPTSKVKRAAPGGAGFMLNMFHPPAMRDYLQIFDTAFNAYGTMYPRAMYHDSYEYSCNWSPGIFAAFEKRRGYSLKHELPALFRTASESDRDARVRHDFRETLSDILIEETLPQWTRWVSEKGMRTRNQAHGSPGNLLDIYGLVDIPETEMFHKDRSKLISKFASSAAHVMGRQYVSAETGTWLEEHFTETLGDMKTLADELFLSGVNHVFYHGTCYSPDEARWPGWLFYASFEMNPRNSIWHDVRALNDYVARCQSVLQSGQADNDVLVYWPVHDSWRKPGALERKFSVHKRDWVEEQPIGRLSASLWESGISFDYISDRQIAKATVGKEFVVAPGGVPYRAIVVPSTRLIPLGTLEKLMSLANQGATVVFDEQVPRDVPGLGQWEAKRESMTALWRKVGLGQDGENKASREVSVGKGRVMVGGVQEVLKRLKVRPETMVAQGKLSCIRRTDAAGHWYFMVNETAKGFEGWVSFARPGASVVILDPMTGRSGRAGLFTVADGVAQVFLKLEPNESIVLRLLKKPMSSGPMWTWRKPVSPQEIQGSWEIKFVEGGPVMPKMFRTSKLGSWTEMGGSEAQRFAGTAVYRIEFDAPAAQGEKGWILDLGTVAQSARVRVNGEALGTLISAPFRAFVPVLKPKGNILEVEVTNVSANRIRDLDVRRVAWKTFHDINFVNINYHPFDASQWPITASGLLGPVTVAPAAPVQPGR